MYGVVYVCMWLACMHTWALHQAGAFVASHRSIWLIQTEMNIGQVSELLGLMSWALRWSE